MQLVVEAFCTCVHWISLPRSTKYYFSWKSNPPSIDLRYCNFLGIRGDYIFRALVTLIDSMDKHGKSSDQKTLFCTLHQTPFCFLHLDLNFRMSPDRIIIRSIKPSCGTKALSYPIHQVQAQQCEPIPQAGRLQPCGTQACTIRLPWMGKITFWKWELGSWRLDWRLNGLKCPQVTLDWWFLQEVSSPLHRHFSKLLGIKIAVQLR